MHLPPFTAQPHFRSLLLLGFVTLVCLVPFRGKAFHLDDPLFIWSAQHISEEPLSPYGFDLNWDFTRIPMWAVTKNPPLTCYYGALIGTLAGWSERAWHLGFLLPALALALGSYRLARRFTQKPFLAAAVMLLTPGVIVSATSVMCDVMMLALWVWAAALWIEGIDPVKPRLLVLSGLLLGACALTKYFGACLVPLLFVYSLTKTRRLGAWAWYLLIPVFALIGYQFWTRALYGRSLLSDAFAYASTNRGGGTPSLVSKALIGLSFLGGCVFTGLSFVPWLWSRRQIVIGAIISAGAGVLIYGGWIHIQVNSSHAHWKLVSVEIVFGIAGGVSILALTLTDVWRSRNADALFLALWVLGVFVFASFFNWTVNARTLLPLVPAAGILLARRLEICKPAAEFSPAWVIPLVISAFLALWLAWGDTALANSARRAAQIIMATNPPQRVQFEGHWGFQYYMQLLGAQPCDVNRFEFRPGTVIAIPANNTNTFNVLPKFIASEGVLQINVNRGIATISPELGAGFYSSLWGPLPFGIGRVPAERYYLLRLDTPQAGAAPAQP